MQILLFSIQLALKLHYNSILRFYKDGLPRAFDPNSAESNSLRPLQGVPSHPQIVPILTCNSAHSSLTLATSPVLPHSLRQVINIRGSASRALLTLFFRKSS